MIINTKKYIIVSNGYPLKFYSGDGCMNNFFKEVLFFDSQIEANNELNTFDEPENFIIVEVDTTYEF